MGRDAFLARLSDWSPLFSAITMLSATGVLALGLGGAWWVAKRDARLEENENRISEVSADLRELSKAVASLALATGNTAILLDERTKRIDALSEKVEILQERMGATRAVRGG